MPHSLSYVKIVENELSDYNQRIYTKKFPVRKEGYKLEKILIVEDEAAIRKVLQAYLKKAGFEVIQCARGDEAIELMKKEMPELVLLDVMLPGKSGWEVLSEIKEQNLAPVIMLTALGDTPERVKGLHQGADDYIAKPFAGEEVVARVGAVLRRAKQTPYSLQRYGALEVNQLTHQISLHGKAVDLTPKDTALLLFLCDNPNHVFSREQLLEHVWGWDYEGSDRAVDLSVKRIRKELQDWSPKEGEIKTIRGMGYQFSV